MKTGTRGVYYGSVLSERGNQGEKLKSLDLIRGEKTGDSFRKRKKERLLSSTALSKGEGEILFKRVGRKVEKWSLLLHFKNSSCCKVIWRKRGNGVACARVEREKKASFAASAKGEKEKYLQDTACIRSGPKCLTVRRNQITGPEKRGALARGHKGEQAIVSKDS